MSLNNFSREVAAADAKCTPSDFSDLHFLSIIIDCRIYDYNIGQI